MLAQSLNLNIGAETGTVASGLVVPLVEGYSKNGNSDVVDASGNPYVGDSFHNITAVAEQWAREGNYVIRVYADDSNYPNPDYAYRAELSDNPPLIAFYPGE